MGHTLLYSFLLSVFLYFMFVCAFMSLLLSVVLCFMYTWIKTNEWMNEYRVGSCISGLNHYPLVHSRYNKKVQLSLTNPRDAKACQNCSNSTCLQRCRWQYWPIFMRLTAIASEIREIPRNSLKIQTYGVQGHPRSSILVSIESPYVTCY